MQNARPQLTFHPQKSTFLVTFTILECTVMCTAFNLEGRKSCSFVNVHIHSLCTRFLWTASTSLPQWKKAMSYMQVFTNSVIRREMFH